MSDATTMIDSKPGWLTQRWTELRRKKFSKLLREANRRRGNRRRKRLPSDGLARQRKLYMQRWYKKRGRAYRRRNLWGRLEILMYPAYCEHCGADLGPAENQPMYYCPSCGANILLIWDAIPHGPGGTPREAVRDFFLEAELLDPKVVWITVPRDLR